jgi:hypothetical protein
VGEKGVGVGGVTVAGEGRYIDRIATIGCTEAARRAGTRLAMIATSTEVAPEIAGHARIKARITL